MLTFKQLRDRVMAQIDERTNTNTTKALVDEYLNAAHALRCTEYAQVFLLWDTPELFSTVVGQNQYSLHPLFDRPLYFRNVVTGVPLIEIPNRTFQDEGNATGPSPQVMQGSASSFSFWGHFQVQRQPTSLSTLRLFSSNGADTGTMIITAIDSSNNPFSETVVISGTTPVFTAIPYSKILSVTKGTGTLAGLISIDSNSGTVLNLQLQPLEFGRQYRQIWLHQRPTTTEQIEYRFFRKPLLLTRDNDVPDIPYPYSNLLVYDALLEIASYNTDTADKTISRYLDGQRRWEQNLADAYADSQTLNALSKHVRASGDDDHNTTISLRQAF